MEYNRIKKCLQLNGQSGDGRLPMTIGSKDSDITFLL